MPVFKFLLEQPGECPRWGGTLSGQGKCPGDMPEGGMPRGNVLHSCFSAVFGIFGLSRILSAGYGFLLTL